MQSEFTPLFHKVIEPDAESAPNEDRDLELPTIPARAQPDVPANVEAEEALLGSILIGGTELIDAIPWLKPEHFYIVRNAWIYDAILALHQRKESVDHLTVVDEMRERGQLAEVGGSAYIGFLANQTPTHTHFYVYARIVESAARRRRMLNVASGVAAGAFEGNKEQIRELIELAQSLLHAPDEAGEMNQYLVPLQELKNLPQVTWLIPGEIPERGITMLYGPSGVGKSFVGLHYAMFLGQTKNVLYVAAEGQGGFYMRTQAWLKHHKVDEARVRLTFFMNVISLLDETECVRFVEMLRPLRPDLIVVDTLSLCLLPGDENSTRDMGMFIKSTHRIMRELKCAILFIHHTGKEGKQERGSSALKANCDVMFRLTGDDDMIIMTCTKAKEVEELPDRAFRRLPVMLDDGNASAVIVPADLVVRTKDDKLTRQQKQVLDALALETSIDGASNAQISSITDIPHGQVSKVISRLIKLGFVEKGPGEGRFEAIYLITKDGLARLERDELVVPSVPLSFHSVPSKKHDNGRLRSSGSIRSNDSLERQNGVQKNGTDGTDGTTRPPQSAPSAPPLIPPATPYQ
jgi:DNA-binding MarR family transcriptional regulator/archaellum biogenesis ATPase FlaH